MRDAIKRKIIWESLPSASPRWRAVLIDGYYSPSSPTHLQLVFEQQTGSDAMGQPIWGRLPYGTVEDTPLVQTSVVLDMMKRLTPESLRFDVPTTRSDVSEE